MKRYWGAYGNKPDDADLGNVRPGGAAAAAVPQPGALRRALERRPDLRLRPRRRPDPGLQARRQLREGGSSSPKNTLGSGSAWDIAFSKDPQQRYIYHGRRHERGGARHRARDAPGDHELRRRRAPARPVLRRAQHRHRLKGNIYTTETYEGKRLQKFVFKGTERARGNQGVLWPRS